MRKCIRCGNEMKEGCAIKIEGGGNGIVLSADENKLFGGRIGKPKVAICPNCGEVSIYIEDLEKLKSKKTNIIPSFHFGARDFFALI